MSAATSPEVWADWCEDSGSFSITGTRMKEHSRESRGIRWCFHCRQRQEFFLVITVPDGLSYYGPSYSIDGPTSDCTDLFPGREREWSED